MSKAIENLEAAQKHALAIRPSRRLPLPGGGAAASRGNS
jgi:hypothetical protein